MDFLCDKRFSSFCMVIMCKLSPYTQTNCVCVHSPIHERVIVCQFLAFFEALKAVGLASYEFEAGIRTIEHKRMGYRGKTW